MGAALCRVAGGVSVTGDCYVSKGMSNLMINDSLLSTVMLMMNLSVKST